MGLKNPDLKEYRFKKINVQTQEITIKKFQDWILKYSSVKRNTLTVSGTILKVEKVNKEKRLRESKQKCTFCYTEETQRTYECKRRRRPGEEWYED